MLTKEWIVPLWVAALAVGFIAISALVLLTRGHPWCIAKKLRIGAMLLSLTAAVNACGGAGGGGGFGGPTCYLPAPPPNNIVLEGVTGQADGTGAIPLHLPEQNLLSGTIYGRVGEAFSYRILDSQGEEVARGAIAAADGAFDSSAESIHITVDPETPPGRYAICLFDVSAAEQPASITSSTSCYPVEIVQATDSEPTAE